MTRLQRLLSVGRYPQHLVSLGDMALSQILPHLLRAKGCEIGRRVRFVGLPIISLAPESSIIIGEGGRLVSRSSRTSLGVNHPVVLRTLLPGARIALGPAVGFSGTTICAAREVVIEHNVLAGANVTIVDTDFHAMDAMVRASADDRQAAGAAPVHIEANVFIGAGSFVLKGVRIGEGAVVGAGSVVTRSVPAGRIVAGNPAKEIGSV